MFERGWDRKVGFKENRVNRIGVWGLLGSYKIVENKEGNIFYNNSTWNCYEPKDFTSNYKYRVRQQNVRLRLCPNDTTYGKSSIAKL